VSNPRLGSLPLFDKLNGSDSILIAGAGGGFDVFCGLPLYFSLKSAGKSVHLANLSFTDLPSEAQRRSPALFEVNAETQSRLEYFPEKYLSEWFKSRGEDVPIWCFDRTGHGRLVDAYDALRRDLKLDAIILVDGGTDCLMRGDEFGLGTPHEDIVSIAAVDDVMVESKLIVCLGFGVDSFHGVCHAHFLERISDAIRLGGFLGAFALTKEMKEFRLYEEACSFVFARMPEDKSIVSSSILHAVQGEFGDVHATDRTRRSRLWINPLMSLYWCIELSVVARQVQYLEAIKGTVTFDDVRLVVDHWLESRSAKAWTDIPV